MDETERQQYLRMLYLRTLQAIVDHFMGDTDRANWVCDQACNDNEEAWT